MRANMIPDTHFVRFLATVDGQATLWTKAKHHVQLGVPHI